MDFSTRKDSQGALYVRLDDVVAYLRDKAEQQRESRRLVTRGRTKQAYNHAEHVLDASADYLLRLKDD